MRANSVLVWHESFYVRRCSATANDTGICTSMKSESDMTVVRMAALLYKTAASLP